MDIDMWYNIKQDFFTGSNGKKLRIPVLGCTSRGRKQVPNAIE